MPVEPVSGGERWVRRLRTTAAALAALLPAGVVGAVAGQGTVAVALIVGGGVSGAVAVVANARLDALDRRRAAAAAERERLALLATTAGGFPDRVPRVCELSPYDVGADHEAIAPERRIGAAHGAYFSRDRDDELDAELRSALETGSPQMVVLRGPSKAGKSRSLYEAVRRNERLRDAAVLKPRDIDALTTLLAPRGLPSLPDGPVLVWLDDLELYTQAGHRGIHPAALAAIADWPQPTVVVATAGGKGSDQSAKSDLAVPIEQLYGHPRVRVVPLSSDLTEREQAAVRADFEDEAAEQIIEHGIGEYLVAAPALARKLEEERARPASGTCPEGAALVWAAIDWARIGMTVPLPAAVLRTLWPAYLHGQQPTDERFARALEWATEPVYRSIALVHGDGPYEAYDWIVAHADERLQRPINERAWDQVIEAADPGASFALGIAAHGRNDPRRGVRAFSRSADADDVSVAGPGAFNLGVLLEQLGDSEAARAAYRRAIDSGHEDVGPMAAFNLGLSLEEMGDVEGARAAYQEAIDSDHRDLAPEAMVNLGVLLETGGDVEGARAAYRRVIDSGHPDQGPMAAVNLGFLLKKEGDLEGARVLYQQAIDSGHHDHRPKALVNLGVLRKQQGDRVGARAAYREAIDSGHVDAAPAAAFNLGVLLEEMDDAEGARAVYQQALDSGHDDHAPTAAFRLGLVLAEQGDRANARTALETARDSGDEALQRAAAEALAQLDPSSMP